MASKTVTVCDACGEIISTAVNWGANKDALYYGDADVGNATLSVFLTVRAKPDTSVPCDICTQCAELAMERAERRAGDGARGADM